MSHEEQQELRLAEEAEQVLKRLQATCIQRKKVGQLASCCHAPGATPWSHITGCTGSLVGTAGMGLALI